MTKAEVLERLQNRINSITYTKEEFKTIFPTKKMSETQLASINRDIRAFEIAIECVERDGIL